MYIIPIPISRAWCEQAAKDEAAHGDPDCTAGVDAPREQTAREMEQWHLDRLRQMAETARTNAERFGLKLLKGYGYPDEVMRDAQDALALEAALDALARVQDGVCQAHRELMKPEDGCPWCDVSKLRLQLAIAEEDR